MRSDSRSEETAISHAKAQLNIRKPASARKSTPLSPKVSLPTNGISAALNVINLSISSGGRPSTNPPALICSMRALFATSAGSGVPSVRSGSERRRKAEQCKDVGELVGEGCHASENMAMTTAVCIKNSRIGVNSQRGQRRAVERMGQQFPRPQAQRAHELVSRCNRHPVNVARRLCRWRVTGRGTPRHGRPRVLVNRIVALHNERLCGLSPGPQSLGIQGIHTLHRSMALSTTPDEVQRGRTLFCSGCPMSPGPGFAQ